MKRLLDSRKTLERKMVWNSDLRRWLQLWLDLLSAHPEQRLEIDKPEEADKAEPKV